MSRDPEVDTDSRLVSTGIRGLDDVLNGGLTPDRVYLVEGNPGSGKTTLALQFLLEGVRLGEAGLYVTLSETKAELAAVARSHGWSLDGLALLELIAPEEELDPDNQYSMFRTSEVELGETTQAILAEVGRSRPKRVVIDSLSEVRLLSQNSLRYRRQVLALKQFFIGRECTVFLLDDKTSETEDLQLQGTISKRPASRRDPWTIRVEACAIVALTPRSAATERVHYAHDPPADRQRLRRPLRSIR